MKKLKFVFLIVIFLIVNVSNISANNQMAVNKNEIVDKDHYKFQVPGIWSVGLGVAGIRYGIWFSDINGYLLIDFSPYTKEKEIQMDNWSKSKEWIENYAKSIYEDELLDVEVYRKFEDGLSFKVKRKNTEFYARIQYKMTDNYLVEIIGISKSEEYNQIIDDYTKETAKSFEDLGTSPTRQDFEKNEEYENSKWNFANTYDPFYTVKHYFDREERPEASLTRQSTDYIIKWKSKDFGILMGKILKKDPNEIKSSDLDHIKSFDIRKWREGDSYQVFVEDMSYQISSYGIGIKKFDDFIEFKNLERLNLSLRDFEDITPIWKITSLKDLSIMPNKNLKSISGIEQLVNLEKVEFWGDEFSKEMTDISPLSKLEKLKDISCTSPGVKDLSSLANMKNLESIFINCHKDTDIKVIIDAEQIKKVMINAKMYR